MVAMEPLGIERRGSTTIDVARLMASTPTYIQAEIGNTVMKADIPPINIAEWSAPVVPGDVRLL